MTLHVKVGQECQTHKSVQQAPAGQMGERNIEGPWSVVSTDIIGSKPPSKGGYKYILVFQDVFTKYVELRELKKANARRRVLQPPIGGRGRARGRRECYFQL